jgi:hypothetical protein
MLLSLLSLAALAQQLQATGVMLSSIAVRTSATTSHVRTSVATQVTTASILQCRLTVHNACTTLLSSLLVHLVLGRSCVCAGCHMARYCGRGCQLQAWRQHKPVCKLKAKAALLLQQEHMIICFPPLLVYEVWSIQHAAQAAQPVLRGSSRGALPLVLTVADHNCSQHTTVQLTTHSVC